ncbi:MAG TPA: Ig-like domain-containing protein [Candidatus Eisenbacteria bacterium]|nr:Ig-like domain-containing protein [Candidatus Eisenbacteria bacterium]
MIRISWGKVFLRCGIGLSLTGGMCGLQARAQKPLEPEAKPGEVSNIAVVEVTPDHATATVGAKMAFKAVAKDAAGNTLPDAVKYWFAAPFDVAGADQSGEISFFQPGEVTIGALIGSKIGYAHVTVEKPHIVRIDIAPVTAPLPTGGSERLTATPRNPNGDPRTDIALKWTSLDPKVAAVDGAGLAQALKPGKARIQAEGDGKTGEITLEITKDTVSKLAVSPETVSTKTGTVVHFAATDKGGAALPYQVAWSVQGNGAQIYPDGAFVADAPGTYTVLATVGGKTAAASVVAAPRDIAREVERVGFAMPPEEQFAEEWIWDHYAYLSSISDKLYIYDISDPAHPVAADPLKVDARLINDVSVTADGKIGVLTREGASSRKNGIVFFDTSDPMHPKVISEYTATVTGGVHSAYLNSHYAYITDDATGSMRVIDFADVKNPKEVARWEVESSGQMQIALPEGEGVSTAGRYLHDLQVIDGLAYLAYWRDGLVILDVGNGIKGGSPEHPKLVSNYRFNYDEMYGAGWLAGAHAVYHYKNYVFVGDEVFPGIFSLASRERIPVRGIVHVVDVSDLQHPNEVATYSVPEAGAHNIWVFDDVLYMGYYNGGARVLDVSGELRGELYDQGREIAHIWSGDAKGYRPNLPFAWGAYPHGGMIYVNDVHTGLRIYRLGKHRPYSSTTAPAL